MLGTWRGLPRQRAALRDSWVPVWESLDAWTKLIMGVPTVAQQVNNPASIHEDTNLIPGLAQWVKGSGIAVSCCVGHGHGSDLALLWLWHRLVTTALIQPLAWEFPYASSVALKRQKRKRD